MDYTCRTKTVQSVLKDVSKNRILLHHKLQRPEGQWNSRQRSDLIDSLLRKYPINPTYGIKEDNIISIIDGVQRISTLRDFCDDKFALSKTLDSVFINDEEKEIAGKKFSKLDEDVQDALKGSEIQVYELTNCTDKDVREMFRRQNAGKPLNNKLMRVVHESDEFSDIVYDLANHPFMDKLVTKAQRKNGTDKDLIIQAFMLILTNQENDFTSFRTKDIDCFVINQSEAAIEKSETLRIAMNKLNDNFDDIKIPVTSIPMILYSAYRILKDKKSFENLVKIIKEFLSEYEENEEYKKYVVSGTSSNTNVRGRFDWWRSKIRTV